MLKADLRGDGQVERLVLDPGKDPSVSLWRGAERLWQDVPWRWRPWKLAVADLEGRGRKEIVVALHKSTRYLPKPHNCLFVYHFDGETVHPKWLGSSLGRPFTDFTFGALDGDRRERLVSVDVRLDGRRCVAVYTWTGFGFEKEWERGAWKDVRLMGVERGAIVVEADGRRTTLRRPAQRGRP